MALEDLISEQNDLLKEFNANFSTWAKVNGSVSPTAGATESPKRGPGRPKSVTLDEVKVIAEKLRDQKGAPAAVALIKAHGAEKLGGLAKEKYPAFIAACEVALNTEDEVEGGGDDSL